MADPPRGIKLATMADVWLRHRPGTDIALLNSLAHVVIEEGGLFDKSMLDKVRGGFEEYARVVEKYNPEKVADITGGVAPEMVRRAAEIIAGGANL